jgi:DNA anti-recombination protein RmuC
VCDPAMVIHLPNESRIVIDSKTPLSLYIDAIQQNTEEEKTAMLRSYAFVVLWEKFSLSPAFVILFCPTKSVSVTHRREIKS